MSQLPGHRAGFRSLSWPPTNRAVCCLGYQATEQAPNRFSPHPKFLNVLVTKPPSGLQILKELTGEHSRKSQLPSHRAGSKLRSYSFLYSGVSVTKPPSRLPCSFHWSRLQSRRAGSKSFVMTRMPLVSVTKPPSKLSTVSVTRPLSRLGFGLSFQAAEQAPF